MVTYLHQNRKKQKPKNQARIFRAALAKTSNNPSAPNSRKNKRWYTRAYTGLLDCRWQWTSDMGQHGWRSQTYHWTKESRNKMHVLLYFIYIKLTARQNNQWQKSRAWLALGDNYWEWRGGASGKLGNVLFLVPGGGYERVFILGSIQRWTFMICEFFWCIL